MSLWLAHVTPSASQLNSNERGAPSLLSLASPRYVPPGPASGGRGGGGGGREGGEEGREGGREESRGGKGIGRRGGRSWNYCTPPPRHCRRLSGNLPAESVVFTSVSMSDCWARCGYPRIASVGDCAPASPLVLCFDLVFICKLYNRYCSELCMLQNLYCHHLSLPFSLYITFGLSLDTV